MAVGSKTSIWEWETIVADLSPITEKTGWIVAVWGWLLSVCPSVNQMLVFAYLIVAILQGIVLARKICRGKDNDEN